MEKRKFSINTVSHNAPTVPARFMTHDGSATIHHGGATNAHDVSTIRYGASTIQTGSATVASRPPANVHDLRVVMRQFAKLSLQPLTNSVMPSKEKLWQNKNSHLTHRLGSVLSQVQCQVQLYQMTSSSSGKLAI